MAKNLTLRHLAPGATGTIVIRERQVETPMRHLCTPIRMAKMKRMGKSRYL